MNRDLRSLFAPESVAIVGASDDPAKWGHVLARGALRGEGTRPVYLVNRRGGTVLGRTAYRSPAELPGPAELVVLAVPAAAFERSVDEALAAGARAIVAISAGLGEQSEEGRRREQAVVERVRGAGAVLLGPNCLGVSDAGSGLGLAWSEFRPGPVGLVSQSGNLALEVALLLADAGLGISRFASLGNQADLEVVDLVEELGRHEPTRLIALYVEDFRDGRAFAAAAQAAVRAGKPVVLLAAGGSDAAAQAARSHTGALVSGLAAVDAACRAAGIVRVGTPKQLVDVALALLPGRLPQGRRVAVFGDGGGHGVVAADVAAAAGLELPPLSSMLAGRLSELLPPTAQTRNPVDLAGGGEQDVRCYDRVGRALLESGEVDAVLLSGYFGGYGGAAETEVARSLAQGAGEAEVPLLVHTMYPASPAGRELAAGGVPVYREVEAAAGVLARLCEHAETRPRLRPIPPLPPAPPAPAGEGYFAARALVAAAGIELVAAREVRTLAAARAAAAELGYPVALKALAELHKSDAGGVVLGLADDEALAAAFAEAERRLAPPTWSVERMAPPHAGVELLLGVRRDRRFGPVALVGVGGVHTELIGDVAVALAPVDEDEAAELIRSLRAAPLLAGARGRPAVALDAAAAALARLSAHAAALADVDELEVNPLLVTADGALALDARVVLRRPM